jgi:hypothetical protein
MRNMRARLIGTAAAIVTLAVPGAALGATYTVDPADSNNDCSSLTSDFVCPTLQEAAEATAQTPTVADRVEVKPSAQAYAGATFADDAIEVVAAESSAPAPQVSSSLRFTGGGSKKVQRLVVRSAGTAIEVQASVGETSSMTIESSFLSGQGSSAGLATTTTAGGGSVSVTARHVTIADGAGAPAVSVGTGTVALHDSVAKGSTGGASLANTLAVSDNSPFVDAGSEDFHLRADAASAIDDGDEAEAGEVTVDVDGTPRPGADLWDRGADEFVNRAPSAPSSLGADDTTPFAGQTVTFSASGASDPDVGGTIAAYEWSFGDGSAPSRNPQHAYSTPGTYEVRARAIDNNGGAGPDSAPLQIVVSAPPRQEARPVTTSGGGPQFLASGGIDLGTVTAAVLALDRAAPSVGASFPRRGQTVLVGRDRLVLRGTAADEGGLHRVELSLSRRTGSRCAWFDGRRGFRAGRCAAPRFFRAIVDDFTWRYTFPHNVRPLPGAYELRVRAFDIAGNRTAAFAPAARTLIPFRFARAPLVRR